jgi:flavin reductase (DIM6/NTAB) family NADH-FMN oxidoreductase RutF
MTVTSPTRLEHRGHAPVAPGSPSAATAATVRDEIELSSLFRDVMSSVCSPVSVVTTHLDGEPFGTTVSAFASLSMSPPMVLVCLDESSDLLAAVRRTDRFGLNVLSSAHRRR